MSPAPPPWQTSFESRWWERRWLLAIAALVMALPLLLPDVPPLTDLPGHMGRYRVQLELDGSPALQRFYHFEWALIANLGIDLLVIPLAPLFGLELAVKLIVLSIPVLTAAGAILVAREVHGRVPPTIFAALPLAYNHAFLFGFANFALSMALALLSLGLWLRLDRLGRIRTRAALFAPLSLLLWVVHIFGWGTLGAAAFSAEVVRAWDRGERGLAALWRAALNCLPLAPPVLLILLWRAGDAVGGTGDWFNWLGKLVWLATLLRDQWLDWDILSVAALVGLLAVTAVSRRLQFSRNLIASAAFLFLLYLLLPRILFGSAYADMRLAPYALLVAIVAIRLTPDAGGRLASALAIGSLAFMGARVAGNTWSAAQYDRLYDRELSALAHLPTGARLVSLVGSQCGEDWAKARTEHLPAMALVRRRAFSNDQWVMAGAQLLRVRYAQGRPFTADPSQIVVARQCPTEQWRTIDQALRALPRDAFDYLWLIQPPPYDARLVSGFEPIWRSGTSVLFRISTQPSSATSDTPTGSDTRPTR